MDPTLLRRRHTYPAGPFFVLDFDSYWLRHPDRIDELDPQRITDLLDQLHAPVGEMFQRSITDRLREVLRKQP
ncbi:MAG: TIGR04255 family protein [Candidatus Limnocylindria bacterium]